MLVIRAIICHVYFDIFIIEFTIVDVVKLYVFLLSHLCQLSPQLLCSRLLIQLLLDFFLIYPSLLMALSTKSQVLLHIPTNVSYFGELRCLYFYERSIMRVGQSMGNFCFTNARRAIIRMFLGCTSSRTASSNCCLLQRLRRPCSHLAQIGQR